MNFARFCIKTIRSRNLVKRHVRMLYRQINNSNIAVSDIKIQYLFTRRLAGARKEEKKRRFDENGPRKPKLRNMILFWKFFLVFYVLNVLSRWYGSVAYGTRFMPIADRSLPRLSIVMPTLFWDPTNPMYVYYTTSFPPSISKLLIGCVFRDF